MAKKKQTSKADRETALAESTLEVICRGVVGYISYLASCQGRHIYSEHVLYEPILRIGLAQGYAVTCEVALNKSKATAGDHPRIDFYFDRVGGKRTRFGIEVKWTKAKTTDVRKDVKKLKAFAKLKRCPGYVVVFRRGKFVKQKEPLGLKPSGDSGPLVEWKAGKTHYWARWYRVV